jgi:hypothetical protein
MVARVSFGFPRIETLSAEFTDHAAGYRKRREPETLHVMGVHTVFRVI